MKIALCQVNTIVGNFEYNKEKILKYYNECIDSNANIAVFPELSLCGYPPQDLLLDEEFIQKNMEILKQISMASSIPIIVGYVRKEGKRIYNSAAICYEGKLQSYYDKILLPTYDVFDEARYFKSGLKPAVCKIPYKNEYLKLGIQICEDLWDDDYDCKVSKSQLDLGAQIIINISASPYHKNRLEKRNAIINKRVSETKIPFLYCNMVGAQDELIFDGQSMAISKNNKLIGYANPFEEKILFVNPFCDDEISLPHRSYEEKTYKALCLGVKDYFDKTGHGKAVLGLSGGIDSALVASIAVDALGSDNVYGVSLPSKYSSDHSISDAKDLANSLGLNYMLIPIESVVNEFEILLNPYFKDSKINVAEENIQARVRGNILMSLSNKFGWMVLSTGNKTELALGYCTLYGDMSGGLSVISDLSKTDVYALSKWINTINPGRVPKSTIEKPPSAELSPGQVDPFDYDIVSPLVDEIIEGNKTIVELEEIGFESELINSIMRKIRTSEYKRRQAAPGLKVSQKAFGIGRRFPLVNQFNR